MKWYADMMDIIAEGREAGIEIGRQQIIANVLSRQKSISETAKLLGCSYAEVAKTAKNQGIPTDDLPQ